MAVSAVPGSGKTWTLSHLAANIISSHALAEDQEVLVVTLTNSAVDLFRHRIGAALAESEHRGLLPRYRVRTLHGLAHDLLRERPDLAHLDSEFQIIDEFEANYIRRQISLTWLRSHPDAINDWLKPDLLDWEINKIHREQLPRLLEDIALSFIRTAKSLRLTPERIKANLDQLPLSLPLAQMGCEMYLDYQRSLAYRGAIDFDDLTRLSLEALDQDKTFLERLRNRYPFILEDEAQDSNPLQEQILSTLSGDFGNWVRVGDPNQAIFETFTTASPKYLRDFLAREDVDAKDLPHSSRFTCSIIHLANQLIHWTRTQTILPQVNDALTLPEIKPVPPDDEAPNPPDTEKSTILYIKQLTAQEEIHLIADSLARWLPEHRDNTVAVLAATNNHASNVFDELKRRNIPSVDHLLRSASVVRSTAACLVEVLEYLDKPDNASKLASLYELWRNINHQAVEIQAEIQAQAAMLRKCTYTETFLYPRGDNDWLENINIAYRLPQAYEQFLAFRQVVQRWQGALALPIDQILLTVAQDLFTEAAELALVYDMAVLLRRQSNLHPNWRMAELTRELSAIARNERSFSSISEANTGFNPEDYKGHVVVCTLHKAKGLEWDRVYLTSVNNYDFPFAQPEDNYTSERWFIRDRLNLEAETLAQLRSLLPTDEYEPWYDEQEGIATLQARFDYVRERLRLLYVGITRAKRELILTWNTGKKGSLQAAVPFLALHNISTTPSP